jgi:hypothetical protein
MANKRQQRSVVLFWTVGCIWINLVPNQGNDATCQKSQNERQSHPSKIEINKVENTMMPFALYLRSYVVGCCVVKNFFGGYGVPVRYPTGTQS